MHQDVDRAVRQAARSGQSPGRNDGDGDRFAGRSAGRIDSAGRARLASRSACADSEDDALLVATRRRRGGVELDHERAGGLDIPFVLTSRSRRRRC